MKDGLMSRAAARSRFSVQLYKLANRRVEIAEVHQHTDFRGSITALSTACRQRRLTLNHPSEQYSNPPGHKVAMFTAGCRLPYV
jgi:hypothetical protein